MGFSKQDLSSSSGILSLEKLECSCVILNKTLCAPPVCEYTRVNSTQRKYSENLHREITTANWGLATTNQPKSLLFLIILILFVMSIQYYSTNFQPIMSVV